jgi:hypothetical protein
MEKEPKSYGGKKKSLKILNTILPKISIIFLPIAKNNHIKKLLFLLFLFIFNT